ncbi:MAG: SpoIIE family protein phosphatase [Clostridiales bacterium]|nr:SpoIIE family protein phosphatase [Clostridiales bacterium]
MKKFKGLIIGGIQNKIFNLILFTVILLVGASTAVFLYHNHMLSDLVSESGAKQQKAIGEVTSEVLDQTITVTLGRSNRMEAMIADGMFDATADRVAQTADYAATILAHPDEYKPQKYAGPVSGREGEWALKVIFAESADASDPDLQKKIGLLANMAESMISMCRTSGMPSIYIALPEGVHMSVSDDDGGWFVNGGVRRYDPRTRGWYQRAAEEGKMVFTDGEYDATSGAYCIECAAPVYGPDGSLCAVIGADMFLSDMQKFMEDYRIDGEYRLLINPSGRAVLAPLEEEFPMDAEERGTDLRESRNELLRETVNNATAARDTGVRLGKLADGKYYYISASDIPTTGWVMISAYTQEVVGQTVQLMQGNNEQIQKESAEVYQHKRDKAINSSLVLMLGIAAVMLIAAILQGRRIVRPLNKMTKHVSELREGNLEFQMEDTYRTGDEVEELAQSFATLTRKIQEYVETVKTVTAEKERIGTELTLATQIQASMLPHIVPAFPDRNDFDVLGSMDPAKEVGGDFYDYFLIDPDHLGVLIADVSGKGVPAALFMMASKIILQSVAMLGGSPAEILTKTNEAICSNNEAQMFVTVWVGILELSTGKLTAANAGHEYPVLKNPDGRFELLKDKHGFVIGGMEGARYREYELQLRPGSKLFLYTDGVPEATSAEKELFGTDRMLEALNEKPDDAPANILKNVRKAVDGFVKEAEQFDDLTMLCLEYYGPEGKKAVRGEADGTREG